MSTTLFPLQYLRQNADPIDVDSVFNTTADRIAYLTNGRRYPGQIVADLEDGSVYVLDPAGTAWVQIGGDAAGLTGQVQYNNGGNFDANQGFTYDGSTCTVGLDNINNITTSVGVTVGQPLTNAWISLYGDLGVNVGGEYSSGIACDSAGNIYSVGADGDTGTPFLVRYTSAGTISWQLNFTEINNYYKTGDAVQVDSSGNIYVIIGTDDSVTNFTLIKINSGLSIQWQLEFNHPSGIVGLDIALESSGNVIIVGAISPYSPPPICYIAKISSAGTIIWQQTLTATSTSAYPGGIAVDSLDNIYVSTQNNDGVYSIPCLVKYNSAGDIQWQIQYSDGANNCYSGQVAVDSADNIYTINSSYNYIVYNYIVSKWDTTGTLIWQKQFNKSNSTTGIAVDGSDNIYVSSEGLGIVNIDKLDSSGNIVWQRTLTGADGVDQYYYWSAQNLVFFGTTYSVSGYTYSQNLPESESILSQLPVNGGGTGTWGGFTYSIGNTTVASGSFVPATGTLISATGVLTPTPGSFSTSAASRTNNLIPISGTNTWNFNLDGSTCTPNYKFPSGDGINGNVLTTDGCGGVSWKKPVVLDNCNSLFINNYTSTSTGCNNLAIGNSALQCNTIGCYNIGIGEEALKLNTAGSDNVAVGSWGPLVGNTTGACNIAIGRAALSVNMTGNNNIAIGQNALYLNCVDNNIAIGKCALVYTCNSCNNLAIGIGAGGGYTALGSNNTIIGSWPGTTGLNNTVIIATGNAYDVGATERIKVDSSGLYINGVCWCSGGGSVSAATPTTLGTVFGYTSGCGNTFIGCCAGNTTQTGYSNIAIGCLAFKTNTTGYGNTAIGICALTFNTIGCLNVGIGGESLRCNTNGYSNTAVGHGTLFYATTGKFNTAIGFYSMGNVTVTGSCNIAIGPYSGDWAGDENIAIGVFAGQGNPGANENIAIGKFSLVRNLSGSTNTAVGSRSLGCNVSGSTNIGIGLCAGCAITTGSNNTVIGTLVGTGGMVCTVLIGAGTCERIKVDNNGLCVNGSLIGGASPATPTTLGTVFGWTCSSNVTLGHLAGNTTMTGSGNIAIGCLSLKSNVAGARNIALGYGALYGSTCGNCNIAIGVQSMCFNCRGNNNVALGSLSLANNFSGCNNIAVGKESLFGNNCGCANIAQGYRTLYCNTFGNENIAFGTTSLANNTTGSCNIAIGQQALFRNTTGVHNIAQGYRALYCMNSGCGNIGIGRNSLYNSIGSQNIAIGTCSQNAGVGANAQNNISMGQFSLYCITSGFSNIAIGALSLCKTTYGCMNIAIGTQALLNNTTGYDNIAIGWNALCCNTTSTRNIAIGIGALSSSTISIGGDNIAIGCNTVTNGCLNIIIGQSAQTTTITSCNQIVLGTTQYTSQFAPSATWSALSDGRDKNNIEDITVGLNFIRDLRPVKFIWETRDGNRTGLPDSGFIAQELLATINKYGVKDWLKLAIDDNPEKLYADPGKLMPVVVKAIQELADEIIELRAKLQSN